MSAVPASAAQKVDARDAWRCVRCGLSLEVTSGSRHHRQRRAVGKHRVSNIVLLCGSGSTGCHGWVHAHPKDARAHGWIVAANGQLDPAEVPIRVVTGGHFSPLVWVLLDDEGDRHLLNDMAATAQMRELTS